MLGNMMRLKRNGDWRRGAAAAGIAAALMLGGATGAKAQLTGDDDVTQILQLNTITTAVPFLMIGPDSRSGAIGDAGVALSPDANSLHWNVGKLAFTESEFDISLSYAPWLRALVDDMNLAYLTMNRRINKRQAWGGALRYFSLGNITFTDQTGAVLREFNPAEFSLDLGFSQKLSDRFSGGIAGRFINSNLTGGTSVMGANTKPGRSAAVDVGLYYTNPRAKFGQKKAVWNWGLNISNIGAKMSYTEAADRDFIPANFRLGTAIKLLMDDYNSLTFTVDANKLLVPTTPIYDQESGETIVSGYDPTVGPITALWQSWYDAPGIVNFNDDGTYTIEEGSILREELREVNLGGGIEYDYNSVFAFRAGFFNEHYTKGNRQFITLGAGIKYTVFTIDLSYLIATRQLNPLANTLRFTLRLQFDELSDVGNEE
jgi:hypothetical protein